MPDFLLEIGTEEVPASAVVPAMEQVCRLLADTLARERLDAGEIRSYGTPRRLVVAASGVAARQPDGLLTHRGPARSAAFDAAGRPTRAAEGFARRYGLTPDQLSVRATESGEYCFAEQAVPGRDAVDVLADAAPALLSQLTFPKFMRWGEGLFRYSRPIRWLVCLLDDQLVPFTVQGVTSGRRTAPHRFLTPSCDLDVGSARDYLNVMDAAHVVVHPEARRGLIVETGNRLARAEGLRVLWDEDLLNDVCFVVEHPTPFLGAFSPAYLSLPRPVLVSAMKKHQRYFTLEDPEGNLAPHFLAVRNGGDVGLDIVRTGNERVLEFRFNDAAHHFDEDRKTTLAEKRDRLRSIVFMQKLGSLLDRSRRLEALAGELSRLAGETGGVTDLAEAARLCKADLASAMVAELPELQGVIGAEYGRLEGLPEPVCTAIAEQYLPRHAGDALPCTTAGRLLSLADRLDLLVAAFCLGHVPTGSSDPLGLRRAAAAVVQLLAELPASLRVPALLRAACSLLAAEPFFAGAASVSPEEAVQEAERLIRTRLDAWLEEAGIRLDLREALLAAGAETVPRLGQRARFLQSRLETAGWEPLVQAATRIRNILRPTDASPTPGDPAHLSHPAAETLSRLATLAGATLQPAFADGRWDEAWETWTGLLPAIEAFFEEVLVNDPDPAVRAARLGLLRTLDAGFLELADFSRCRKAEG